MFKRSLIAASLAQAATTSTAQYQPFPEYDSVIALSDSILGSPAITPSGFHDYREGTLHRLQAEFPPLRVINLSEPGVSATQAWEHRVDYAVRYMTSHRLITAVWITYGINDYGQNIPIETFKRSYGSLLFGLWMNKNRPDRYCVLPHFNRFDFRPNRLGHTMDDYRQVIRAYAAQGACILVDTTGWIRFDTMPDGLHFSTQAHSAYMTKMQQTLYIN